MALCLTKNECQHPAFQTFWSIDRFSKNINYKEGIIIFITILHYSDYYL